MYKVFTDVTSTSCFRDGFKLMRFHVFNRKLVDDVLGSLQERKKNTNIKTLILRIFEL